MPTDPRATKQQLREEIARLRHVGRQMSNIMFNLAQSDEHHAKLCKQLQLEWDGIKRSEAPHD